MSDQIAKRKYRQSWHGMTPEPKNCIQTHKLKQFAGPVKRRLFGRKAEKENAESSKDMFEEDEEFAPSSPKVEDAAETKPVPSNTVPAPLFFKMSNEVLSESESEESPALEEEQSTADEETTGEEQTSTAEEQSTTEEETTTATVKETTSTTEEVTTATAEEQSTMTEVQTIPTEEHTTAEEEQTTTIEEEQTTTCKSKNF